MRSVGHTVAMGLPRAICFSILLGLAPIYSALASHSLPPPPALFILDEPGVLQPKTISILNQLFQSHERETGEQLVFAIFQSLSGEDLVAWTHQVFQAWKIGRKGKDNGVLLALYWKDRKARIEVGYGLEGMLTDALSKRILAQELVPQIKQGHLDEGLLRAAVVLLRILQSPLIQNGEAAKILKGDLQTDRMGVPSRVDPWVVWFFLGMILLVILRNIFFPRDIYYTEKGWGRSKSYRRRKSSGWGGWWGGGGGSGGGFGGTNGGGSGGGFSGGGGSSGGGGASDNW